MPDGDAQFITKVIATGVAIVVGISDNRQITFQSGFEGDEPDDVVNARFDRLMKIADRQRARYEIKDIEKDVAKARDTLSQLKEDRARVAHDHEVAQAKRRVELEERGKLREGERQKVQDSIHGTILKMQDHRKSLWNEGEAKYRAAGRMGSYQPKGIDGANIDRIDKALETAKDAIAPALAEFDAAYDEGTSALEAEIAKADAEAAEVERNMEISVTRHTEFLEAASERLADCQRTLAGG